MTIESKIDELIAAVERLTCAVILNTKGVPTVTISEEGRPVKVAKKQEAPAEVAAKLEKTDNVITIAAVVKTKTVAELQELCLKLVRADPANKKSILGILVDLGAKLIKDVKEADLPILQEKLEALAK